MKQTESPTAKSVAACLLCNSSLVLKKFNIKETMFLTGQTFNYTQCGNCESLSREESIVAQSALYPENYYSLSHNPIEIFNRFIPRFLARTMAHSALKGRIFLLAFIKNIAPKREVRTLASILISISRAKKELPWGPILDVGTGSGMVPYVLGLDHSDLVSGIDPFATPKAGTVTTHSEQKDLHGISGTFDLIMFHHSLEHVDDIQSTLSAAKERLGSDGRIIIRIPTISSYAWRTYVESWYQLDAPRHRTIPSRRGLVLLAERCGLSIIHTYDDSTESQFWISEYVLRGLSTMDSEKGYLQFRSAPQSRLKLFKYKMQAKKLNRAHDGDQTVIVLKRKF